MFHAALQPLEWSSREWIEDACFGLQWELDMWSPMSQQSFCSAEPVARTCKLDLRKAFATFKVIDLQRSFYSSAVPCHFWKNIAHSGDERFQP